MELSCAQAVIDAIAGKGVDTVFGIPGVHTLELYRALANSGMRHITPRHEQGAAFMADGYARASGRTALCVLISGPGLLNAATAIGQAYSDSIPMLVLATVVGRADLGLGRGRLHDMPDQLATLTGMLRDQARRINHPSQARALVHAMTARQAVGRPRPAYIEIPLDIAAEPLATAGASREPASLWPPAAAPEAVAAAAAILKASERIVFVAGGGAVGASDVLDRLARRLGAVVMTTIAGKGVVPEIAGYSLGASLNHGPTRRVLDEADLVVVVGSELSSPDHFMDFLPIEAAMIRIDLDAEVLGRDYPARVAMLADARTALDQIEQALGDAPVRPCWRADCAALREARRAELRRSHPLHTAILDVLYRELPEDTIFATDMTQLAYTGNGYYPSGRARSWLHPVGFGTLGYGLPAAIGAKLAQPDRPVVALAGDYGVGFTLSELATASDLGLNLPLIIWNNGGLGQIADDMDRRDIPRLGVEIRPPDFAALAQGYGAGYSRVGEVSALGPALAAALGALRPTVIEIVAGDGA